MAWRLAKALEKLRSQANAAAPNRDKSSDGTIGDRAHSSRTSDHNEDPDGTVRALDLTHDPKGGMDSYRLAKALADSGDQRIKYLISTLGAKKVSGRPQGQIWNPSVSKSWRPYDGQNPHDHHVHISVKKGSLAHDASEWDIGLGKASIVTRTIAAVVNTVAPPAPKYPTLKRGAKGADVEKLQRLLGLTAKDIDGDFGKKTEAAVKSAQRRLKIVADGIVGPYTWRALGA